LLPGGDRGEIDRSKASAFLDEITSLHPH